MGDNKYTLIYKEEEIIDKFDLMKTKMYKKVNVFNSGKMVDIDLEEENFIYLKPQKQGTFNRYNMAKF